MFNPLKLTALALPVALMAIFSTPMIGQETDTAKLSPAGTWNWERKSGEDTVKCKLVVSQKKDGSLTGKYQDKDRKLDIKNAKLEEGNFSFDLSPNADSPEKVISFSGKLTTDSIEGTMSYSVGDEKKSKEWVAKRLDPLKPAIGKWELEFETPDGNEMVFIIDVSKKGDKLALDFVDDDMDAQVSKVTFKKNTLSFDSSQVYQNQPLTVEWDLKIKGKNMNGTLFYAFENGEEEGELDVYGQKIK